MKTLVWNYYNTHSFEVSEKNRVGSVTAGLLRSYTFILTISCNDIIRHIQRYHIMLMGRISAYSHSHFHKVVDYLFFVYLYQHMLFITNCILRYTHLSSFTKFMHFSTHGAVRCSACFMRCSIDIIAHRWTLTAASCKRGSCDNLLMTTSNPGMARGISRAGVTTMLRSRRQYDEHGPLLTYLSLEDLDAILKMQFSVLFYSMVSPDLLMIMPLYYCHVTSLKISKIAPANGLVQQAIT